MQKNKLQPENDNQQQQKFFSGSIKVAFYIFIFLLWVIAYAIAVKFSFGIVYFLLSCIAAIFLNLGKREKGTLSAYSIFNEGCKKLPGEFGTDQVEEMLGRKNMYAEQEQQAQKFAEGTQNQSTDNLYDPSKLSKLSNQPCPCGSGRKFKKCCIEIERSKREELRRRKYNY